MEIEELKYLLALKEIKGIGNILAKQLITEVGSAKGVFNLSVGKLLSIPRITDKIAKSIQSDHSFQRIEEEIDWCNKNSIEIIPFTDPRYPYRLLQCHDAPLLLFVKGDIDLNPKRIISIVGTRKNTSYGQSVTEELVESLAHLDVTIVSGLALGIDGIAHKQSITSQLPTIGVLGHALNQIYPRQHASLSKKMLENKGGLVSEFSTQSVFDRNNFPMRNRIVAGMSDATILIESAASGGAMITAEIAYSYGREVFAVPGKWNDTVSQGPNKLLKQLKAQILTHPNDLAEALGWKIRQQLSIDGFYNKKYKYQHLEENELKIVSYMESNESSSMDMIHYATEIPISTLSSTLLSMEFKGILIALPGKRFQLK